MTTHHDRSHDERGFHLAGPLRQRIATWEQNNHVDGVLRTQNVPITWALKYDKDRAGHVFSNVQLTWSVGAQGTYTYLSVQSDLATKKISDIKRIPRPSAGTGTTPQPKPGDKPGERPDEGSGNRPETKPGDKPGNTPGNRPEDMRDSGPMRS